MNLYRITRKNIRVYDEFTSMVVRANDETEARKTASAYPVEISKKLGMVLPFDDIWLDPEKTTIELIELSNEPEVISAEFRHG